MQNLLLLAIPQSPDSEAAGPESGRQSTGSLEEVWSSSSKPRNFYHGFEEKSDRGVRCRSMKRSGELIAVQKVCIDINMTAQLGKMNIKYK